MAPHYKFICFLVIVLLRATFSSENIQNAEESADELNTIHKGSTKSRTLYDYQTRIVAYKDLIKSRCLLEFLKSGETFIGQAHQTNNLEIKTKDYLLAENELTKRQIWSIGGQRISEFCRGFPTYLIQDFNATDSEANLRLNEINNIRTKRETKHFFVGRIRGQTQSQYLNFGSDNNGGKAEAESTNEGSRAVVSGSSGMGQAQSQSSPYDCDECQGTGGAGDQQQALQFRRPGQAGVTLEQGGAGAGRGPQTGGTYPIGPGRPGGVGGGQRPGYPEQSQDYYRRPGAEEGPGGQQRTGYPGQREETPSQRYPGSREQPGRGYPGQITTGAEYPGQAARYPGQGGGTSVGGGQNGQFVGQGRVSPGYTGGQSGGVSSESTGGHPGQITTGGGVYPGSGGAGYPGQTTGEGSGVYPGGARGPGGARYPGQTTTGEDGVYPGGGRGQGGSGYPGQSTAGGQVYPGSGRGQGGAGYPGEGGEDYLGGSRPGVAYPEQTAAGGSTGPGGQAVGYPGQTSTGAGGRQGSAAYPGQITTGSGVVYPGVGGGQDNHARYPGQTPGQHGVPQGPLSGATDVAGRGRFSGQVTGNYDHTGGQSGKFSGVFSGQYDNHGIGTGQGTYAGETGQDYQSRYPGQIGGGGPQQTYPGSHIQPGQQGTYPGQLTYPGTGGERTRYPGGTAQYPGKITAYPGTGQHGVQYPGAETGGVAQGHPGPGQYPSTGGGQGIGYPGVGGQIGENYPGKWPESGQNGRPTQQGMAGATGEGARPGYSGTSAQATRYPESGGQGSRYPGQGTGYPGGGGQETGYAGGGGQEAGSPAIGGQGTRYPASRGQQTGGYPGSGGQGTGTLDQGRYQGGPTDGGSRYPGQGGGGDSHQFPGIGGRPDYSGSGQTGGGGQGGYQEPSGTQEGQGYPGQGAAYPGSETIPGVYQEGTPGQTGGAYYDQSVQPDDSDSQAETSVQGVGNGTQASASAQGKHQGGTAQSQVAGTYSGSGSFSASAGSDDGKRGAQTQVSGGSEGARSSAQGRGGLGQSQAQVQLASDSGDTISSSQTSGFNHGSQTQVQASGKGGMADAQADGPGSTSSQAQIGFAPQDGEQEDDQAAPFNGGGMASAQSGTYAGQAQSQIQGKFHRGIRYTGAAQAGSGSKDFISASRNSTRKLFNSSAPANITAKPVKLINDEQNKPIKNVNAAPKPAPAQDQDTAETQDEYDEDYYDEVPTAKSTNVPETRSIISQRHNNLRQHIIIDPKQNIDATVLQSYGEGALLQPGQYVPGMEGYQIPAGFRGRVKSSSGGSTYASGQHAQAQTVNLTPGTGRVIYKKPVYALGSKTQSRNGQLSHGSGYTYHPAQFQLKSGGSRPNFYSLTKSESGLKDLATGQKTPSVSYTQSSTCGVFSNTCVFNGAAKLCFPQSRVNQDGTVVAC